jgi:ABC-type sugar transport system ATPase subunit
MDNSCLLELKDVSKAFGPVQALEKVSFRIAHGEIHAVLGENGAGKSTLMKIISGNLRPDEGSIVLAGKDVTKLDPKMAQSLGIAMVHQELSIFENLTVAENIIPPEASANRLGILDRQKLYRMSEEWLSLFNLDIRPNEKMTNLSLAEQQVIEILRAISMKPKLLILDEPTAALSSSEAENLFEILKRLRGEGITTLYISHRLSEIMLLADTITVLKDGAHVSTVPRHQITSEDELISMMVGREIEHIYGRKKTGGSRDQRTLLEMNGVTGKNGVRDITLQLHPGEIVGLFGLEGSGRNELAKMICGLEPVGSGSIVLNGSAVEEMSPQLAVDNGLVYLSRNRKEAGLFMDMTASDNLACPILSRLSRNGFLMDSEIARVAEYFVSKFGIVMPGIGCKPRNLSGGNQQKLMLSICLAVEPKCLIANEPTRGVDVGAKGEIHRYLIDIADQGTCVLLISSELPEIISLSDRVLVMKNGRLVGELPGSDATEESIMTLAASSLS